MQNEFGYDFLRTKNDISGRRSLNMTGFEAIKVVSNLCKACNQRDATETGYCTGCRTARKLDEVEKQNAATRKAYFITLIVVAAAMVMLLNFCTLKPIHARSSETVKTK
jgi:hypothetical protein